MQVVHLNKGHLPRNTILRNSKLGITHGLHFTYEELARSPPFMCWFCIAAGMCRLVRPQMSTIPRIRPRPNEYIVADEIAFLSPSFEGFIGYLFIACLCTDMEYAYGYKSVSEFAVLLRRHFSLTDPSNFPRHFPTRWIGCDHLNVHLGQALRDLQDSLSPRFEVVVTAAEDKERSRAEPRIQRVKILHRVALLQNRAPNWLWFKALEDVLLKRNETARGKEVLSPCEKDAGVKPDWSRHVAFYARGMYHIHKPDRIKHKFDRANLRGRECHSLGSFAIQGVARGKNSYWVLDRGLQRIFVSADAVFSLAPDGPNGLMLDPRERTAEGFDKLNPLPNHDELFAPETSADPSSLPPDSLTSTPTDNFPSPQLSPDFDVSGAMAEEEALHSDEPVARRTRSQAVTIHQAMSAIAASDESDDDRSLPAFFDGYDSDDSLDSNPQQSAHHVRFANVQEVREYDSQPNEEALSAHGVSFSDIDLGPHVPTASPYTPNPIHDDTTWLSPSYLIKDVHGRAFLYDGPVPKHIAGDILQPMNNRVLRSILKARSRPCMYSMLSAEREAALPKPSLSLAEKLRLKHTALTSSDALVHVALHVSCSNPAPLLLPYPQTLAYPYPPLPR